MSQQPSRIVIYSDGTGQSEYNLDKRPTNVSRIKRYVRAITSDNTRQSTFYVQGIGAEGFHTDRLHQANAKGGHPDQSAIVIAMAPMQFLFRNSGSPLQTGLKASTLLLVPSNL